jgi:hypothetical protein
MIEKSFSETTLQLLHRSGWHEKRNISVDAYISGLSQENYRVTEAVVSFLSSFGGLCVIHPDDKVPGRTDFFHLDPIQGAHSTTRERVEAYEERTGEQLCVIGEAYSRYMILMMSPTGAVYAAYDDILIMVGGSGTEAIEAICRGGDMEQIP